MNRGAAWRGRHGLRFTRGLGLGAAQRDGYVGYMPADHLSANVLAPTHMPARARQLHLPLPDIKTPPLDMLTFGARRHR